MYHAVIQQSGKLKNKNHLFFKFGLSLLRSDGVIIDKVIINKVIINK